MTSYNLFLFYFIYFEDVSPEVSRNICINDQPSENFGDASSKVRGGILKITATFACQYFSEMHFYRARKRRMLLVP